MNFEIKIIIFISFLAICEVSFVFWRTFFQREKNNYQFFQNFDQKEKPDQKEESKEITSKDEFFSLLLLLSASLFWSLDL